MNHYDHFARFYDPVMGDRSDVVTIVRQLIETYHPTAQTVLELGCGTGSIMAGLAADFTVSGIDRSAEMLYVAQRKLPQATFHQGTIAAFDLGQTYDVLVCVFDTINHLTSFAEWQSCLADAARHLSPQGLLIFDMNTIGRMQYLADVGRYTQEFDGNTMTMDIETISDTEVAWHITVQEPQSDGVIQLYEELVHEVSFPLEQVEAELECHFAILAAFDSEQAAPSPDSDRVYYACRRLSTP